MKRKTMNDKPEQPQPPPAEQPAGSESGALIEPSEEAVVRLEGELADMKDKYLRLAAEYDNFKKRSVKERTELWQRAQADLIRSEEHTSELQSQSNLVCRLLLE